MSTTGFTMDETLHLLNMIGKTESPIERLLFCALVQEGVGLRVKAQYKIGEYRLDFAASSEKLAIECDGHDYHSTKTQLSHDAKRDRYLLARGWHTMRFTGSQIVREPQECAREVRRVLDRFDMQQKPLVEERLPLPTPAILRENVTRSDEVSKIFAELERRHRSLLASALEEASHIEIKGEFLRCWFPTISAFSRRVEMSRELLRDVSVAIFDRPLQVITEIGARPRIAEERAEVVQ